MNGLIMRIFRYIRSTSTPVYCAWCRKHLKGPDPGYDASGTSHGICDECDKEVRKELLLEDEENEKLV